MLDLASWCMLLALRFIAAWDTQARRLAEQAGDQNRLKKLDEQAGGSMVTSATFATQADETGSGLQFLNIIKVPPPLPSHI